MSDSGSRLHSGLRRLFAAAFSADCALYLVNSAVPFKALRLGADPLDLGLLATASTGAYALFVNVSGRASDRFSRLTLARLSCMGVIVACIGFTLADQVSRMLLFAPVAGASLAFFWPCTQASIADRSTPGTLARNLGRFNMSWSSGKGLGFLCGGALLAAFNAEVVFTLGSVLLFGIFFVLPYEPAGAGSPPPAPAATETPRAEVATGAEHAGHAPDAGTMLRATRFRRVAWVANGTAYGVASTLIYHYPRLVQEHGWSARTFGLFMGGLYFTQTIAFVILTRSAHAWRFRRAPLYVPQLLLAAGVLALPLASGVRLGVTAIVFGFALSMCYSASIYYSLLGHTERGKNAGVHELLIGLGSMTVPLAGGFAARTWGLAAPYAVAAAVVVLSVLAQEIVLRAGSSGRPAPSRADTP